jgi:glycosyltransferase involved in cell wall biosynthesis
MLRSADRIVTLTEASVPYLRSDPEFGASEAPISVIPTCVDLDLFTLPVRPTAPEAPFVLGYVGQVGTWYLLDEMVSLFAAVRRRLPNARLLFVNQHQHTAIHDAVARQGIGADAYEVISASREEVPALIGRMTIGMALIKPAFSKISSCPTKLAEYLACGVPCIGNARVGDMTEVIERERVGVALHDLSPAAIDDAADAAIALCRDAGLAERCRQTAVQFFSLEQGVEAYAKIYADLETAR